MAPKAQNIIRSLKSAADAPPVAGFLEYKPGPGIYSRLERAVQQLPENVRVQELPGLLKRYKDGIPGWELKAVDLDSVVAGRTTVPRDELLAAVRERSPVFTHGEVVLGGKPIVQTQLDPTDESLKWLRSEYPNREFTQVQRKTPIFDSEALPLGQYDSASHGLPKYEDYSQGGKDYTEVLLVQPEAGRSEFGSHWSDKERDAVAHLRFDTHGDALRINELQSDLGIHNREARERSAASAELAKPNDLIGSDAELLSRKDGRMLPGAYVAFMREHYGVNVSKKDDGSWVVDGVQSGNPFPLEDAWADILTKRALLEAARQGHRAIEVASPRAIADKVGGNIDNYEHFYGKVVPGSLERLGRKMGGLREELVSELSPRSVAEAAEDRLWRETPEGRAATSAFMEMERIRADLNARYPSGSEFGRRGVGETVERIVMGEPWRSDIHKRDAIAVRDVLWNDFERQGYANDVAKQMADKEAGSVIREMQRMQDLARMEHETTRAIAAKAAAEGAGVPVAAPAGRRYVLSDEMRKRIINDGIPASIAIAAGLAAGGNEAEAGPLQAASDAAARAAMPASTVNSIRRLKQQAEAAYLKAEQTQNPADFKRAENLDAKLEDQYEKWDSRLEDLDEGDGDVDMEEDDPQGSVDEDMEPNDWEGDSRNYSEDMRQVYGNYLAGRIAEEDLANALRGVGPDTAAASKVSDDEIIREAKSIFDQRQAQLASLRSNTPEGGVRAMQAQLRDLPAGALPVPIMAQAQSVNESRELPAGSGGSWGDIRRNLTGDFDFSMAISPEEWEDYYQKGESPEHQKFKANVAEVMNQPIIRVGAANDSRLLVEGDKMDRITPAQFVKEYLDVYGRNLDENARAQVAGSVMAKLDGSAREPNFMADDIVDRMMGSLRESSPQGKYAKMDPMPQEQLDAMRQQYGDWADSMLTPGTAENFEALRGYELLRTTLDGQHAPVYADSLSNAAAFVGGFVDPKSRQNFGDATFESGPEGRFRRANRDYFSSRTRPDEPAAFRDPDGTSRFASTSASNIQGMLRAGGDTSNPIGAISWPLYESFSEFSRTPVGKAVTGEGLPALWEGGDDWNFMAQKRQAFDREQPIQPAGMTREEFDRQLADHRRDREQGEAWGATTFPNVQGAFDTVTGSKTQRTWGPPVYNDYVTNFLPNTVGNIPSAAIMAGSAATGGVLGGLAGAATPKAGITRAAASAASGVARGAARGAGATVTSQIKDAPFDFATDQAVGGALGGGLQNYIDYITTAEQNNALLPDVDPNEIPLEELNRRRAAAMETREDRFKRNQFDWNRR